MNLRETIKKILKEESDFPLYLKRRLNIEEDEVIDMLKKFSVRSFQPHKRIEVIVAQACGNTAYEIIDAINPHMSDEEYRKLEQKFKFYLQEKYRDFIKEYLENYFSSQGDEYGTLYMFWKHEDRNGGNGFTNSFPTWNKLLMEYGWWFPDLDWPNLKKKLDSMADRQPLLIKRPGDKNNTMNYYFSLFKINKSSQIFTEQKSKKIFEGPESDYAVIKITKPLSRMSAKDYYQVVPLWKTLQDKIFIKKGGKGLSISTKNIEVLKKFKENEKEEMTKYLNDLKNEEIKKWEQTEGELTERCWKGYTQKGMKTMFGKRYPNCVKKTK